MGYAEDCWECNPETFSHQSWFGRFFFFLVSVSLFFSLWFCILYTWIRCVPISSCFSLAVVVYLEFIRVVRDQCSLFFCFSLYFGAFERICRINNLHVSLSNLSCDFGF